MNPNKLNVPEEKHLPGTQDKVPYVIVGDEAFPLTTYLMRPYPGSVINGDIEKQVFYYRLSQARRVSKNTFGHFAKKILNLFRSINYLLESIDKIIMTTCILHNYIRRQLTVEPPEGKLVMRNLPRQGGNALAVAFNVREKYKIFFNSASGSLPWQRGNFL
ncbi:hypothetical protein NQ314_010361 [Rhamnusium bicolor]|uniref:DDE Tnp4 domain-containing protein n=1 Tax=Rhamnusium bicolor TaxID=1586634 RepID=A0AAV8XTK8_9CUCU|nr:hypothetical protein NQ314_010361 [Rhamnusium bicolor]